MSLTVGSLFSGIGGFELGLERAGMRVVWQVENDPYCQRVLAKHWPEVKRYGDIKEIDWSEVERPDLICGGFPCQPVSVAGKRLGTEDDRWLWPEFARCLRVVRPRFVLVENVPGLLSGPMGEVLGDLACLGYDAEWESLPAAAFGAPHLRYRVWIVADAARDAEAGAGEEPRPERERTRRSGEQGGTLAHAPPVGQPWTRPATEQGEPTAGGDGQAAGGVRDTEILTERPGLREAGPGGLGGRRLGDSDWWRVEPDVGRVAHGVPRRVDRLRGLGNAVVPQLAEWLGRRILEAV